MQPGKPNQHLTPQQPDQTKLGPEIKQLIRKIALQNWLIMATPFAFLFVTIIIGNADIILGFFFGVATFFATVFVIIRLFVGSDKFKFRYRQTIVNSFLRNAFNQVEYEPDSFLNLKEFWYSGLSESVPNNYHGSSYIRLERPGYVLETTYLTAYKVRRSSDGGSTNSDLLHSGYFLKYSMRVHFPAQMIILKDTSGASWVNMNGGPEFIFNSFNRIRIKNLEFEKHYEVYTKDEDKGYQFLDQEMQQFLLDLKSKAREKIQVSFMDHAMYLSIEKDIEPFQPGFILFSEMGPAKRTSREVKWLKDLVEFIHPKLQELDEKYGY